MAAPEDALGIPLLARLDKAAQIAHEQLKLAEKLVSDVGVGGEHPDRERLLLAAMHVIALNFHALETKT